MRPVKIRALSWGLLSFAALLPLAHADILQFDFTGALFDESGFFTGDSFQVSFLANTSSGSLQYTLSSGCLGNFSASLPIYDVDVIANGKQMMQNGTGSFALANGAPVACGLYFDDPLSINASKGSASLSLGGGFDQIFPNNSQSAILGAKDPLALILNSSDYGSAAIVITCDVPGLPPTQNLPGSCSAGGQAKVVPEPGALELFAAGALGLMLSVRRKQRSEVLSSETANESKTLAVLRHYKKIASRAALIIPGTQF